MGKTEDDTQNYSKQWKDDPQNYINNKERKDDESSSKPNKPQIEKVLLPFFFLWLYFPIHMVYVYRNKTPTQV